MFFFFFNRELAKIIWQEVADLNGVVPFEIDERSTVATNNDVLLLSPRKDDHSVMMTASLRHQWFESSLRYCDSLFVISCQNASGEMLADTQASYARFLLAGGANKAKAILLLASSMKVKKTDHDVDLLRTLLLQAGLEHEANLL